MKAEIAIKAATLAIQSIGIVEKENKDNHGVMIEKYLKTVGLEEGNAWCAAFLKYMYMKSAMFLNETLSDEFLKLDGYTPNWKNYAKKHNIWISLSEAMKDPSLVKTGFPVCFYSKQKDRIYHIGIVTGKFESKDNVKGVNTVEGNTSGGLGVDANGGGVFSKRRSWTSIGEQGGFIKVY
jgi:hypothetical protein